jgi:uncharacterized protein YqgV (UPF0045/DUF77 family)
MIAEIQCLPTPAGTPESTYAHIEAAIAVVSASGLTYEVGALGTTVEGPAEGVWTVLRQTHEATIASGASSVVTVLKVYQTAPGAGSEVTNDGPGIDDLVAAHR